MTRITEKQLAERFKDREGMLEALRQAGRLARLRREMWARFRASIESESAYVDDRTQEGTQERKLRAAAPPPRDQRPASD